MSLGGDTSNFQDQIIGHKINELSLNSGEFLSTGDALHMFSADEKQLMKDSTPNDFSHIHNCDSWNYISINSVTPPSWYSGSDNYCFDNKDKNIVKERISIGKYLSLRSEPLGCLEGDGKDGPCHENIFGCRTVMRQYSSNKDEDACKDIKEMEEKSCSIDSSFSKEEGLSIDISDIFEPQPSFQQSISHEYGRQLSAIAEMSRENDSFQSSRRSEARKGNRKSSTNFNYTNRSSSSSRDNRNSPPMKLKNNKKPNDLESVGRNDDVEPDSRNSQSSFQDKNVLTCFDAKPSEFISDWLEGTSEHFGIDANNDSRIKSLGSSKQCHSSTPIKSVVGRLSSPVSEIGPRNHEQMILSSIDSCVFEPTCRGSDVSDPFSRDQIKANECSLKIIDVVSELRFKEFCCIGISCNEILEVKNCSNILSSINLSLESLSINEEAKNLNDHRNVFSFENKIFLNNYAKEVVKIFFEPKSPGVHVARLVLKVNFLWGGGDGNIQLKRYVTIKAAAEQPVIDISLLGTSSTCQELDFGIIPGNSSDVKKLLITNICNAAIPINVNMCHDKSARECFALLFCLHKNRDIMVGFNGRSDCVRNELMRPGSQILVQIAFKGPDSTIGVKSIRSRMEVSLANLKQDLLSSVELSAVTSVPKISFKVDALVMKFDENTHRRVTKISNKGYIPLHLEMKSQSNLFSIEPDHITLKPGHQFDLAVNYNQFLNNMEEDEVKSEVNFVVLPNGKNYKITVIATKNANIQARPQSIPLNIFKDIDDIDDCWHVTMRKCTLCIDLTDYPENLRKESEKFCISNCSNTDLRFEIMHPKTLSVFPSSAVIQSRSSKRFTISPPDDLHHLMIENVDVAIVSILCGKSVKHIAVNIKVIRRIEIIREQFKENVPVKTLRENTQREEPKNQKMNENKSESIHPLVILSSSEKYSSIRPTNTGWDVAFEDSKLKSSATLKLTSNCDEDIFWHLNPLSNRAFISQNIQQTAQDVFTSDNYKGMLHPRSSTEFTVFFKPPFSGKYCQVWKLRVESDVCFKISHLKLVAEAQENFPYNTTPSLDTEECELSYSKVSTSITSDTNSQIVIPCKYISNAAMRLTSKDLKLQVIPEYLHFNASSSQVEVIEKIEVKNKLNEDTVLHVTKSPQHPFILEHTVFNLKAMHKIKIPVKCLAREAKSSWRDKVEFESPKGDVFIVHLVLNLDA